MTTIYKICDEALWRVAEAEGLFHGAPIDMHDGFIHFSTAEQLAETAAKHFAGARDLMLVAIDAEALGAQLKWEPSRGGALFPHLYAPLPLAAVRWARPLADEIDGRRATPELESVIGLFGRLARPFLHALDPEDAHGLTIRLLKFAPLLRAPADDRRLSVRAFGLNFPNPVGMAAGFDKNAEVPDALLRLGFGFVEVGTVTPLPQRGNTRPRVFRLDADAGVINRLGFNSQGADAVLARLAARASAPSLPSTASGGGWGGGIVGINVGANRDAPDRVADYVQLIERFASVASYVDRQCLLAQHARPAQSAASRRARRPSRPRDRCARTCRAKCGPDAGAVEDRARSLACRSRRRRRHRALAPGRWPDRQQYDAGAARELAARSRSPRKPAVCRAGRCFRSRPACWPKPMCGWRACFR